MACYTPDCYWIDEYTTTAETVVYVRAYPIYDAAPAVIIEPRPDLTPTDCPFAKQLLLSSKAKRPEQKPSSYG